MNFVLLKIFFVLLLSGKRVQLAILSDFIIDKFPISMIILVVRENKIS